MNSNIFTNINVGDIQIYDGNQWLSFVGSNLSVDDIFENNLMEKYKITQEQLLEMVKIHYPENLFLR